MKKLFLSVLFIGGLSAMAQQTDVRLTQPTEPRQNVRHVEAKKLSLSKAAQSGWFDQIDRMINNGGILDNSGGAPSATTVRTTYLYVHPDSFVRIPYFDETSQTNKFTYPRHHNVGTVLDPRSSLFDVFSAAFTNFTKYTVDSMQFFYVYNRHPKDTANYTDTMDVQFYYPTYTTNSASQQSPYAGVISTADNTSWVTIGYDRTKNIGTKGTGQMVHMKIPLTIKDTTGTLFEPISKLMQIAIPTPINLQPRTRISATVGFRPTQSYAPGDTIDGDSAMLLNVTKFNSAFRLQYVYDYTSLDEGDKTITSVDQICNNGLIATSESRYGTWGTTSVFNNRYYCAGWTNGSGLSFNIMPRFLFRLTTENLSVKDGSSTIGKMEAYPNPAKGTTAISFSLKSATNVSVDLFNLVGQKVMSVTNEKYAAGTHEINVNLNNLKAGVYLYSLTAGSETQTQKLVVTE